MGAHERLPALVRVARARADRDGRRRKVTGIEVTVNGQRRWRWIIQLGQGRRLGGRWVRE